MERKSVLKSDISLITYSEALDQVLQRAQQRTPSYACFCNAHMAVEGYKSSVFQKKVNGATFTFADGMPIAIALRLLYGERQQRIAGMDFMYEAARLAEQHKLSVFLFGSSDFVLTNLKESWKKRFPDLKVAGSISPPYRPLTDRENDTYCDQINRSGANIVMVGLGCPKQETWMADHHQKINAVLLGVGGAFEIQAGLAKRAPNWVRKLALEWLFRLVQEPGRLWKRYLVTNTLFLFYLVAQFFRLRFVKSNGSVDRPD